MKTLLQINVTANIGSTGRIASEIGDIALNNGWDSYIAYGQKAGSSRSVLLKIGNDFDMAVHGLGTRLFDNHCFLSKRATISFLKKIDEIKPDIIHLHNIHGYYLNMEVLFSYLSQKDIPVVWTLHDCWPMTGHCAYFDSVNCQKWKTECKDCPLHKSYPSSIFLDRSRTNFQRKKRLIRSCKNITFVTPSQWLKEIVEESFLKDYPVKMIHNGTDVSIFKPRESTIRQKYGIKEDSKVILGVASGWGKRKGLPDFFELSKMIESNEQIVLVGLSKQQLSELPPNIIGIERTENTVELAELYSTADVFANPTWSDNFPTTNIEALACGTPIVTYKTGGSPEAVSSDTGLIVEHGDIKGLYEAIKKIENQGKENFQTKCRERALLKFAKEDRFLDYLNLYRSILEASHR